MKKTDKFQISYAWWSKNKPDALPSTGIGEALKVYEAEKKKFGNKPNELNLASARNALKKVDAARLNGIGFCKGLLFPDLKVVLTNGAAVIAAEEAALKSQYEDEATNAAEPLAKEIAKTLSDLLSRQASTKAVIGKIPSPRVAGNSQDPRHQALVQVFNKVDEAVRNYGTTNVTMSDALSNAKSAIDIAARLKGGALKGANDIFESAKRIYAITSKECRSFASELDAWALELKNIDSGFKDPKKRDNAT